MKKRTSLFKILKSKLFQYIDLTTFYLILWLAFIVTSAIIGFNFYKAKPIPLTEEEINYYTSQAEILFNSGISNLDDNIVFEFLNDGTIGIYSNNEPKEKQKIKVKFFNKEFVAVEPYYHTNFITTKIAFSLIFAFGGFLLFIAFICLTDWIGKKISSIKDDVLTKLQKNKNSG